MEYVELLQKFPNESQKEFTIRKVIYYCTQIIHSQFNHVVKSMDQFLFAEKVDIIRHDENGLSNCVEITPALEDIFYIDRQHNNFELNSNSFNKLYSLIAQKLQLQELIDNEYRIDLYSFP